MTELVLAIAIGGAFGFALDRVGASNPDHIITMLRLSRTYLMRAILFAIGLASVLLFSGVMAGLIDAGHLSIKTSYLGVVIGGAMLGVGFAIAGYCPGTGLAALATGRWDALWFVIGGLLGAFAYMVTYADIAATGLLDPLFGGKATLGAIDGVSSAALTTAIPGTWIGIGVGVLLMVIAAVLPTRLTGQPAARRVPDGSTRTT